MQEHAMAQPHDDHTGAAPASFFDERLRRYLPPDLAAAVEGDFGDPEALPGRMIEAFVHLAATRYTIATYLPRLLVHQLLEDRLESPWVRLGGGALLFPRSSGAPAPRERPAPP